MGQDASSPFTEVRLLGPVELGHQDGSSTAIGSRLERTLLAALAANAGLVVPTDTLVEALWGSSPPATARHALHVHASALRRLLGLRPSPLEARPSGYVLMLGPGQLDTERFEALAARGRAELASNQAPRAAEVLEAALAVWRGPATAGGPVGVDTPVTHFTRRGTCALAYQVLGDGPVDLVFITGFTGHLEVRWEDPDLSRLYRRLAAASRLVLLDKRGTGMSDRTEGYPPLPQHVDDVLAVMDAVGCRRAALFGVMDGGAIALLTAVAHPDRVVGVATYATTAVLSAQHHPPGVTREARATLQDDRAIDPGNARFLADRIPHARLALLAGEDTVLWAGDVDAIAAEIEAWLPTLAGRVG